MAKLAELAPELAGIGCIIPPKPQAPTLLEIGGGRRRLGDTPENLLKEDHYPPLPDGYRTPPQPQPAFNAASNPVAFLHAWQKPGAGMGNGANGGEAGPRAADNPHASRNFGRATSSVTSSNTTSTGAPTARSSHAAPSMLVKIIGPSSSWT